jgi:hypothetical protein
MMEGGMVIMPDTDVLPLSLLNTFSSTTSHELCTVSTGEETAVLSSEETPLRFNVPWFRRRARTRGRKRKARTSQDKNEEREWRKNAYKARSEKKARSPGGRSLEAFFCLETPSWPRTTIQNPPVWKRGFQMFLL